MQKALLANLIQTSYVSGRWRRLEHNYLWYSLRWGDVFGVPRPTTHRTRYILNCHKVVLAAYEETFLKLLKEKIAAWEIYAEQKKNVQVLVSLIYNSISHFVEHEHLLLPYNMPPTQPQRCDSYVCYMQNIYIRHIYLYLYIYRDKSLYAHLKCKARCFRALKKTFTRNLNNFPFF